MITKNFINDFIVFTKGDNQKYISIFKRFLSYNINVIKVFRNIDDTKVYLIDTESGKFILKVFSPKLKKAERFFKSLFKGDYYENLFFQTARVKRQGLTSINDFYLLAEKKIFRFVHTYIMLIEYIEGTELSEVEYIDEKTKAKIKDAIDELHQFGMVSGDPHKGNFIIQNGQIRIIDLSGKSPSMMRVAKDWVDLERHYGIDNTNKNIGYYLYKLKKNFRDIKHRLQGKPVH